MWGTTSIYDFVCNAYPQHQWIKSKFALPATTFWHSTDNVDLYLRWLWDTLKMRSLHDWYVWLHMKKEKKRERINGEFLKV
jgi:hypothetical protein